MTPLRSAQCLQTLLREHSKNVTINHGEACQSLAVHPVRAERLPRYRQTRCDVDLERNEHAQNVLAYAVVPASIVQKGGAFAPHFGSNCYLVRALPRRPV